MQQRIIIVLYCNVIMNYQSLNDFIYTRFSFLAKCLSAAISEEKRLPFAGYSSVVFKKTTGKLKRENNLKM